MMGIPHEGPTYINGDNQSVLANMTIPDSHSRKIRKVLPTILCTKGLLTLNGEQCTLVHMKMRLIYSGNNSHQGRKGKVLLETSLTTCSEHDLMWGWHSLEE